jgi:hypothetical protein
VSSQKILALQLKRFLREVHYKIVTFCHCFKPFFVKYTIVITHIDFFIENNFVEPFCYTVIEKKIQKKICKFLGPDVNFKFYKISNCPTFSAFI